MIRGSQHRTTALFAEYDSATPIALYVIGAVLLTLIAVGVAREIRNRDLADVTADGTPSAPVDRVAKTPAP
ncbi:hypothetical protein E5082_09720 [Streptomyces griseoluteus]|uniref:MFS transporter n=1 Tax=Streptomyces griseoluteus TaxID=29306 RepID=A0A4Z1DKM9_STRGP|nr:hypothetical protein [Streptomyces griseoluteus]TGN84653.1 hypothetical protein E5082_09720 [Streptomyces griseoluteus]GHF00296.1 hypothetical protein GCM10017776_16720 [Streptomyces griseoluteus]